MQQEQPEPGEGWQPAGGGKPPREPVFNLPAVIVGLSLAVMALHLLRVQLLSPRLATDLVLAMAFIPARYSELASQLPLPQAAWWSPVTYSLLHGGWTHLLVNVLWMAAFGSPVARRIGAARFLLLGAIASVAGAAAHFLAYPGELVPMIGASAVVSGYMGAASRFAFTGRTRNGLNVWGPALTLVETFSDRRVLIFVAVWFAINLLFGSGVATFGGMDARIAWQAHIGGFAAGILLFSWFDRRPDGRTHIPPTLS